MKKSFQLTEILQAVSATMYDCFTINIVFDISWIIKCLFLRNMEPLMNKIVASFRPFYCQVMCLKCIGRIKNGADHNQFNQGVQNNKQTNK